MNRGTCRSYVSYPEDSGDPVVKFVGEKAKLKLSNLYHAFDLPFHNEFLKRAIFPESVVFAYTSTVEGKWDLKHIVESTILSFIHS